MRNQRLRGRLRLGKRKRSLIVLVLELVLVLEFSEVGENPWPPLPIPSFAAWHAVTGKGWSLRSRPLNILQHFILVFL